MQGTILNKDTVSQPELWRLIMEINHDTLTVALFPPSRNESPICETLPLNNPTESLAASVREAIYDNPLLLSDFNRVDCLLDTDSFIVIPPTDDETVKANCFNTLFPDEKDYRCTDLDALDCMMIYGVDSELIGFLKRTYYNIRINHRLAPFLTLTSKLSAELSAAIYVNRTENAKDFAVFSKGKLMLANTFRAISDNDITYYITAICKAYNLTNYDGFKIFLRTISPTQIPLISSMLHPLIISADLIKTAKTQPLTPLTILATL